MSTNLTFKGMLPIVKLTKKEYEEEKESYYSVKDIDETLACVYATNKGSFLTFGCYEAFYADSPVFKAEEQAEKYKQENRQLMLEYDILKEKYELALKRIAELEKNKT